MDNEIRRTSEAMDGDRGCHHSDVKREALYRQGYRRGACCRSLAEWVRAAVYVIDGQSTDNTREIAVKKGAQLILEERQGKGQAIQTAFKSISADYAIMVDRDDTYPIELATEMTRLLQTHDVVIESRLKGTIEPRAMTRLNVLGNAMLCSSRCLVCTSATYARRYAPPVLSARVAA
ncbi:MAG: glycosyltransferase [Halobacteriota archaeon]